jgi:predicted RNase H-like HicB family nuclease
VAFAEELPGANTQAETLEEARDSLRDAVQQIREVNNQLAGHQSKLCLGEPGA